MVTSPATPSIVVTTPPGYAMPWDAVAMIDSLHHNPPQNP
jgi:hypothetical protein